jgi:hypothetical protein
VVLPSPPKSPGSRPPTGCRWPSCAAHWSKPAGRTCSYGGSRREGERAAAEFVRLVKNMR